MGNLWKIKNKSLELIDNSDLMLYVLNNNEEISLEDLELLEKIKNKDDLSNNNNWKIYKNYISYIDTIFDCLSPECANLLKSIYFKHIGMDDLGYSITSAYRRLTIAIKTFMEFFDNSLCQSI